MDMGGWPMETPARSVRWHSLHRLNPPVKLMIVTISNKQERYAQYKNDKYEICIHKNKV